MPNTEFRAMGCAMLAALDAESVHESSILSQVPVWFEDWEQILSRFRSDSELSRLNSRAGETVKVSPVLWDVLQESLKGARLSQGLVEPCLLNALESVGYINSFETIRDQPNPAPLGAARPNVCVEVRCSAWQQLELNSRSFTIRAPADVRLDFGGIAKGWAADRALRKLSPYGPALVDAGGDIAAGQAPQGQPGWPVAIGNPYDSSQPLGLLCLNKAGVATSGRDYRKWQQGGCDRHHILDPRTNLPAETDIMTATVVAPTARRAEVAAKTALILGSQTGMSWLENQGEMAGLLVLDDGSTVQSRNFSRYLWTHP
jgi:thiamine biosynthesis lipoprotein